MIATLSEASGLFGRCMKPMDVSFAWALLWQNIKNEALLGR